MPFFVPRLTGPDGKPLPGGRYDFFQAGTTTPKAVYDSAGISLGTSVTVDAGASKLIYLGVGAYKIIAYSATGVQIGPPADNVSSSGLGPDSTGSICIVATYQALRDMVQDYDAVIVLGRTSQNDGGEGIFYQSPIANADDDGIVLLRNTTRYKREISGYIDPLWFGVEYGSTSDQSAVLNATRAASVAWNAPIWITGQVYVASNFDLISGVDLILDGSFASNDVGPSVRFLAGSRLLRCAPVAFSSNIQPVFVKGTTDVVRLSWMGGETTNDAIAKLSASATDNMTAIIDTVATYSGTVSIAANWVVDPSEGLIQFDASVPGNLSIPNVDSARIIGKVVGWTSTATVGTVEFGIDPIKLEWFGAVGDGTTDDSVAITAGMKTGKIYLTNGYRLNSSVTLTNPLEISGSLGNIYVMPAYANRSELKMAAGVVISTGLKTISCKGVRLTSLGANAKLDCWGFTGLDSYFEHLFTNSTAGYIATQSAYLDNCSFVMYEQIRCGAAYVHECGFNSTIADAVYPFPIQNVMRITNSNIFGYGGHASNSDDVTELIENCTFQVNGPINLSNGCRVVNNKTTVAATFSAWHFSVPSAGEVFLSGNTTNSHLLKMSSSAIAHVDRFESDVVNSADATPSATESLLISNGVGTVHLATAPLKSTQQIGSIAGIPCARVSYATPYGGAGNAYNATAETIWGGAHEWATISGSSSIRDGVKLTVADNLAFDWRRIDANDPAVMYRLAAWSIVGGILKVTMTVPAGMASGSLQFHLDTTNGAGASNTLNKRLTLPNSTTTDTIVMYLPYLGGYWRPSTDLGAWCGWYSNVLNVSGVDAAGCTIRIDYVHELPATEAIPQWSQTMHNPVATPTVRVASLERVTDSFIKWSGSLPYALFPARGSYLRLPARDATNGWSVMSAYELTWFNMPAYGNAGFAYSSQFWSDRTIPAAVAANCWSVKQDISALATTI